MLMLHQLTYCCVKEFSGRFLIKHDQQMYAQPVLIPLVSGVLIFLVKGRLCFEKELVILPCFSARIQNYLYLECSFFWSKYVYVLKKIWQFFLVLQNLYVIICLGYGQLKRQVDIMCYDSEAYSKRFQTSRMELSELFLQNTLSQICGKLQNTHFLLMV